MAARAPARRRRPPLASIVLRWLGVAVLVTCALLYYRPLRTYLETREALARRTAEVRALEAERRTLERRLAESASEAALLREARRLGLVKPGERLFIVKGIAAWRRSAARAATIGSDG